MGDYAPFQLSIHSCPPEQADAVVEIIREYELDASWTAKPGPEDTLSFTETYTDHEASLSTVTELGNKLIEVAPGTAWECWQDPKYEFDGEYRAYHPELGGYTAGCDAEGRPHFTHDTIAQWLRDVGSERLTALEFLADELPKLTGRAWEDKLKPTNQEE